MLLDTEQEMFDNVTFKMDTPEGSATVIIVETSPGVIYKIFFTIGKAGSGVNAWAFALAEMVVANLRHRPIQDVLIDLSNISSSRQASNAQGIPCRSGPEALYLALSRYKALYVKEVPIVKYDENYIPPKLSNGR